MALQDETETAEALNVKPTTLAKWRTARKGPPFLKVGRAVRYDPADVKTWLDSRKVNSISEAAE